jgi:predicted nucleotidyltransferase
MVIFHHRGSFFYPVKIFTTTKRGSKISHTGNEFLPSTHNSFIQVDYMPHPTPYLHINAVLKGLVADISAVLSDTLMGVYLYGSLVWGDFDIAISDIDLLVALTEDLNENEFEAVAHIQHQFIQDHPEWNNLIEIAYYSVTALQTFKSHPSPIAIVSPGEPFHWKTAGKDWLINWYMVREKGVPLAGPSPRTIIPVITKAEFIQAVQEQAKGWEQYIHQMRRRPQQAYGILTLCRALYARTFGEQVSKRQAALWAEQALPEWSPLIHNALTWREAYQDEKVNHEATFPETVRFVHAIIAKITAP